MVGSLVVGVLGISNYELRIVVWLRHEDWMVGVGLQERG